MPARPHLFQWSISSARTRPSVICLVAGPVAVDGTLGRTGRREGRVLRRSASRSNGVAPDAPGAQEGWRGIQSAVSRRPRTGPGCRACACGGRGIARSTQPARRRVMKARYLGHVVFYVKDLEQSLAFYRDLLGFKEVGRIFGGAAAALTSGRTHHELLLIQVGDAPPPPSGRRRGLYHIGIKVGDSLDELRSAKRELEQAGITIDGMSDHTVSQSLYLRDPDGNEVELYVDADEAVWKADPAAVLSPIKSLRL